MDVYIDFLTGEIDKLLHLQYMHGPHIFEHKRGAELRKKIRELDVRKIVT